MRNLFLSLSAVLLLCPVAASAAYDSPAALAAAWKNSHKAMTFSATVHANSGKTYVSVWSSGVSEISNPQTMQLWGKATVDIVHGGLNMRVKGEGMAVDGNAFFKLNSLNGSYKNLLGSFSMSALQNRWLKTAMDPMMMGANPMEMDMMQGDTDAALNDMFMMDSVSTKSGTTYTLTLSPGFAPVVAQQIRDMLGETEPASTDFLPWRELAEGMHFTLTIKTNAKDEFIASNMELSMAGTNSNFTAVSKGTAAAALHLKAPANAMTLDEAMATFSDLEDDMPANDTSMNDNWSVTSGSEREDTTDSSWSDDMTDSSSFDSVDDTVVLPTADCTDPSLTDLQLLQLARNGACPVAKTTTRHGW
jgi:hypothetical protein